MSKSSMRIVLVDPLGDILFSGESIATELPAREDRCPETQRSATSDSGIFPVASSFGPDEEAVDTVPENTGEIRSGRTRAA
jgi:hypothetical protein